MIVLTAKALPDIRLTVDEYLEADLPEGNRYELVNGVVELPPAPDVEHEEPRYTLTHALHEYQRSHPAAFATILPQATVVIPGKDSAREPDISVYRHKGRKGRGRKAWKEMMPLLVVEVVSPDQAQRDYQDKKEDYWLAGIAEYWIVDPQEEAVTVLTRGKRTWRKSLFHTGQEARSTIPPGFAVPVARLFA